MIKYAIIDNSGEWTGEYLEKEISIGPLLEETDQTGQMIRAIDTTAYPLPATSAKIMWATSAWETEPLDNADVASARIELEDLKKSLTETEAIHRELQIKHNDAQNIISQLEALNTEAQATKNQINDYFAQCQKYQADLQTDPLALVTEIEQTCDAAIATANQIKELTTAIDPQDKVPKKQPKKKEENVAEAKV